MKFALFSLLLSASQAFAYADKTYECRNIGDLPKNTYKFQTVAVTPGASLPYVEIHRFYRANDDQNSPIKESIIRSYATVVQTEPGSETLQVGALRFEFQGDKLLFCRE